MTSKQLIISFLSCSFLILNASHEDSLRYGIPGVGIPQGNLRLGPNNNSVIHLETDDADIADFFTIGTPVPPTGTPPIDERQLPVPPTGPQGSINFLIPSLQELPYEPQEKKEEVSHGGTIPLETEQGMGEENGGNSGHTAQQIAPVDEHIGNPLKLVAGATQTAELPEDNGHTHEEIPSSNEKEFRTAVARLQKAIMNNPRYSVAGAMGLILARCGYSWWQQRRTQSRINTVLKKYGKQLMNLSSTQTMLMIAAYNKDLKAMHRYMAECNIESLPSSDNGWVMPALELLYNE